MHELSIAHAVVSTVTAALPDADARVLEVRLRVGTLSGVVSQALEFAYDVAAQGTPLADAVLVIETIPVTVYCPRCDAVGALPSAFTFACPTCGTPTGDVRSGKELEVASIVLADPDPPADAFAECAAVDVLDHANTTTTAHSREGAGDVSREEGAGVRG